MAERLNSVMSDVEPFVVGPEDQLAQASTVLRALKGPRTIYSPTAVRQLPEWLKVGAGEAGWHLPSINALYEQGLLGQMASNPYATGIAGSEILPEAQRMAGGLDLSAVNLNNPNAHLSGAIQEIRLRNQEMPSSRVLPLSASMRDVVDEMPTLASKIFEMAGTDRLTSDMIGGWKQPPRSMSDYQFALKTGIMPDLQPVPVQQPNFGQFLQAIANQNSMNPVLRKEVLGDAMRSEGLDALVYPTAAGATVNLQDPANWLLLNPQIGELMQELPMRPGTMGWR